MLSLIVNYHNFILNIKKINKIKMIQNNILFTSKYHLASSTDYYDIIINIKSLKESIKEGIKIEASEEGMNNYNNHKDDYGSIIGIIGNLNVGKSYILSKIINSELPLNVRTKGISIKYINNCIALDSLGSDSSLLETFDIHSNNDSENINKLIDDGIINEKKITEEFLQSFILFSSSLLIIVVGQLTLTEQKFIERIKEKVQKQRYIFIIHNYMFLEKIEDVKKYIKDYVLTSITFGILFENHIIREEFNNTINDIFYTERYEKNNKRIEIIHLFMAKEGSEAGNFYNESTIDYLRKQLSFSTIKSHDVIKEFKNFLSFISGKYMKNKIDIESIKYDEKERKLIMLQPNKLRKYYFAPNEIKVFYNNIIEPSYYYQIKEDKLIVKIEIQGKILDLKTELNSFKDYYYFNYKGKITFPQINKSNFKEVNMKYNEFRLNFKIPMYKGFISNKKPEITIDDLNGINVFTYQLEKNDESDEDFNI